MPGQNPVHPHMSRTEIVLVSYHSSSHVEELVAGWPAELAVVVVDNARGADGLEEFAGAHPNVRYVDGGGQGFGRAANLGAFSTEREFVVFVNPDCRPSADDLESLVGGLAGDPGAASHAATMTGHDGNIEAGVGGWEPTLGRLLVSALGLGRLLPTTGMFAFPKPGEHCDVGWTTGACMAVPANRFRELGGFDEAFYVYSEDVSFGRSSRLAGLRTVLREDVLVRHGSGNSGAPSLEMHRLRGASFAGYLTRYHPTKAWPMRMLLVLGGVNRGLVALLRGHRDVADQQRAFMVGILTMKAYVGGREVAAQRYAEVTGSATPA